MYSYSRSITIDHTKCGSVDSSNFPVLFTGTYNGSGGILDLRTVANGGKVQSSSGYDIAFFSDSNLATPLKFERVGWNASTGLCQFHVKVPTLSASSDTVIYVGYGDSGISTDQQDAVNTWNANFIGVYHFEGNSNDSQGAFNGTDTNVTYSTGNGKYGQGGGFANASASNINLGSSSTMNPVAETVFAWVNATSFPNLYNAIYGRDAGGTYVMFAMRSSGKFSIFVKASADVFYDGSGTNTLSTGTWYRVAYTYDSTSGLDGWFSGASDKNVAANGNIATINANSLIGNDTGTTRYWDGNIDELYHMNVRATPSWITADYNNQNAPGSFYTLGSETPVGGASRFLTPNSKYL